MKRSHIETIDQASGDVASRFAVVRDLDAGSYLESFLVAAVTAILTIRLILQVTGYPQLGGGGFHIAHMLWGGLLMLLALAMLLAFVGKHVKRAAAIVGGLGFGTFIDELGKFITSDNDYFFQPTVGLLYVIFLMLFLLFRQVERHRPLSQEELLVNAADMLKDVLIDGARGDEVARALALLERSGLRTETVEAIRQAVLRADRVAETAPPLPTRLGLTARSAYDRLVRWPWFRRAIVLTFGINAAGTLLGATLAALVVAGVDPLTLPAAGQSSFTTVGHVLASLAVTLMSIMGVIRFARSRPAAYRWFKRSVLVSLLLVQVFVFFQSQFAALGGLILDLVLLSGLNNMLRAEQERQNTHVSRPSG